MLVRRIFSCVLVGGVVTFGAVPHTKAQIETAAAVIGAIATVANYFKPRGGGDINSEILAAISRNLAEINRSLQFMIAQVADLKRGMDELPDRILQNEMIVQITGRLQLAVELIEAESRGENRVRQSFYRDAHSFYDKARNLRADIFSSELKISERLVLQMPLLFMVEGMTFYALNSMDVEDPANRNVRQYYVNSYQWDNALRQYLAFHRFSLDANASGSFANQLRSANVRVEQIFEGLKPEYRDRVRSTNDYLFTTTICHFSSHTQEYSRRGACDESGCDRETATVTYHSLDRTTFVFEKDQNGEVVHVESFDEHLDYLRDEDPVARLQGSNYECNKIIPSHALDANRLLKEADVSELQALFNRRNLLRSIQALNSRMYSLVLKHMEISGLVGREESGNRINRMQMKMQ